jgi:hypothetical protein
VQRFDGLRRQADMRRCLILSLALAAAACSGGGNTTLHSTPAANTTAATTTTSSKPPSSTLAPAPIRTLPWIGTVVEPNTRSPFVHTLNVGRDADAPECTLENLLVTASFGGAGGTEYADIRVRNRAVHPCFVQGSPYVAFLDTRLRTLAAYVPHRTATDPRVVLLPSSWAALGLTSIGADRCGGPSNDAQAGITTGAIAFGFDATNTRVVRSDEDQASSSGCPPSLFGGSYAGAFTPIPDPSATGSFYAPLHDGVVLNAPIQMRRGETASYSVTLTNRSLNTLPLVGDSCPLYRESVGGTVSPTLLLNCNGPGLIIAANTAVRFDMRLAIPANQPLGITNLRWQFIEPQEPPLTAQVTVIDPPSTPSPNDLAANGTIEPRETDFPAAGICGGDTARIQTVALRSLDYVPQPRCLIIRDQQFLRIVNGLTTTITARIGHRLHVTLAPGHSATLPEPIGRYLAPGVHGLRFTPASGADIWVDPICAPSGRPCTSPPRASHP